MHCSSSMAKLDLRSCPSSFFPSSSLGFHEAKEQCKSQSGGHLVAFEDDDEFERLKQFLRQHVVENIRKSPLLCKFCLLIYL